MNTNPIEVLRAACEQIRRSTGDPRQRSISMHQAVYERYRQWYIENIARAERLLGIGCAAQGAFPTGWPWTKRAGRMSREEKQLREDLPEWRLTLASMPPSKPIRAINGGFLLLASAAEAGDRLAVLLAGDRGGGKSALINELRDQFATSPGFITVMGHSIEVKAGDSQRETQARIDAILATGRSQAVRTSITFDVQQSRRPTGKRAQRRAGKEWNR